MGGILTGLVVLYNNDECSLHITPRHILSGKRLFACIWGATYNETDHPGNLLVQGQYLACDTPVTPTATQPLTLNRIYNENCLATLSRMPNSFVDLTVTAHHTMIQGRIMVTTLQQSLRISPELYRITKPCGKLGIFLAKSILHVDSCYYLRKYTLEKSITLQIFDLGQEFSNIRGEQIILFLQKTN